MSRVMMTKTPLTAAERDAVEANRGLIRVIAATMRGVDVSSDDVFQAGVDGLMRAAQKYDPSMGFAFSTYAAGWIKQAIARHAWDDRMVRSPHYLGGKAGERHRYHRFEVATRGHVSASEMWGDGTLAHPSRHSPPTAEIEARETKAEVRRAVARLAGREAEIVRRRMAGETLRAVGKAMGLTPERVRQIEAEAHGRLRTMLADRVA